MDIPAVPRLEFAAELTAPLVAAVGPDQWEASTPCPGWTVRDLVAHVVRGHVHVARAVEASTAAAAGDDAGADGPDQDPLPGDLAVAWRSSALRAATAFAAPGALERVVVVPFGAVPGGVALQLRVVETLVHAWDLARATGRQVVVPDDLVVGSLEFSRRALGDVPAGRRPFGPPRPVPVQAALLDQLAGLLGRAVGDEVRSG